MTFDFRASQIRTNKIITSGSTGTNAALLIYPFSSALNQSGSINTSLFSTASIGQDVFMFVSGTINATNTTTKGITVFGGDVKVSGAFQVITSFEALAPITAYSGAAIFGSTNLLGTTTMFSTASVTGPFTANSTSRLVGATIVSGAATFVNSASFLGPATFTNSASFTAPVVLLGATLVSSSLTVFGGISGSLQRLANGTQYLYGAGGVRIVSQSNGSIAISGSTGNNGRLFMAGYATTTNTSGSPQVCGQNEWAVADWNYVSGMGIYLKVILSVNDSGQTAFARLYNLTAGGYVEIGGTGVTALSSSATTPTKYLSVNLTGSTNFFTNADQIYEVQLYSSTGSNTATLGSAEILMTN